MKNPEASPFQKSFKNWVIPGPEPLPRNQQLPENISPDDITIDALCGHFKIFQLKKGHRYSTDDVLTAWYGFIASNSNRKILDLGTGIGTVAMFLAWKFPGAQITAIEAQDQSAALAAKSIEWNGLSQQITLIRSDFRESGILGLVNEKFDLITGTPPYFPVGAGMLGNHPQKIACRFETRGSIDDYCKVASQHLAPGGVFACVFPIEPAHQEIRIQKAADEAGLIIFRSRAIVLKEGQAPLLKIFAMMAKKDLPPGFETKTWDEPALCIRTGGLGLHTGIHPEYLSVKLSMGLPPTEG